MTRKSKGVRARQKREAAHREELERRWADRLEPCPAWAEWVTFTPNQREPRHRWLPYRQGLARQLADAFIDDAGLRDGPVLDPFGGSGTVALAAAQRGRHGVSLDLVPALGFIARMKAAAPQPVPDLPPDASLDGWAFEHPMHRVAVMLAAARTVSGAGRRRRDTDPQSLLRDAHQMIADDLRGPALTGIVTAILGDARQLPFGDGRVGGVLTSPPYLSRYDYLKVTEPIRAAYGGTASAARQVRAHPGAGSRKWDAAPHPAAAEAIAHLRTAGHARPAGLIRSYLQDIGAALDEISRVLCDGAPAWVVVSGATLKKVYVPADLIVAEMAGPRGMHIERIGWARRLADRGRRLGGLRDVAPRESIIMLRRMLE